MTFNIYNENGTGIEYFNIEDFLNEIKNQIADCTENGGTYYSIEVESDCSCFYEEEDEEEEEE